MAGATSASIRPVALLVCDIRGFSTMAEKISSSRLAQHLGIWFREAGNLVRKNGGTIDKFIGDAVLAYWSGCGTDQEVDCAATLRIAPDVVRQRKFRAIQKIASSLGTVSQTGGSGHFIGGAKSE